MTEQAMPDWQITILLGQFIKAEAECKQLADALGRQGVAWQVGDEGVQWTRRKVHLVPPRPRLVLAADMQKQEAHDELS